MTNQTRDYAAEWEQLADRARKGRERAERVIEREREESGFNGDDYRADIEADRRRTAFGVIADG